MADEQVIKLLEEIRDLQKENVANYKVALQNQQESIAIQKRAVQRYKVIYIGILVLFLFLGLTYFVPMLTWFFSWLLRR